MITVGDFFPTYKLNACLEDNSIGEIHTDDYYGNQWSVFEVAVMQANQISVFITDLLYSASLSLSTVLSCVESVIAR